MDSSKSLYDEIWEALDGIDTDIDTIADHVKDSRYSDDEIYEELQDLRKKIGI